MAIGHSLFFATPIVISEVETSRDLNDTGGDIESGDAAELGAVDGLITEEEYRSIHEVEKIATDLHSNSLGD